MAMDDFETRVREKMTEVREALLAEGYMPCPHGVLVLRGCDEHRLPWTSAAHDSIALDNDVGVGSRLMLEDGRIVRVLSIASDGTLTLDKPVAS